MQVSEGSSYNCNNENNHMTQQYQQQQLQQQQLQQQLQQQYQQQIQQQIQQQYQQQLQQQQQQLAMMQLYGATTHGMISAPITLSNLQQLQLQGGMPVIGHAPQQPHPNQLISVPIQTVYAPQHHSIPTATTLAHPELLLQVQNGSWVAPNTATPMFGSCIVNHIQPGLLTTPLVK